MNLSEYKEAKLISNKDYKIQHNRKVKSESLQYLEKDTLEPDVK